MSAIFNEIILYTIGHSDRDVNDFASLLNPCTRRESATLIYDQKV